MTATPATPRDRASFADDAEISAFVDTLGRFERGELDAEAWRAYRVPRGVYGQRQDGVHMLRIKLPQGAVTGAQLRAIADVATRCSRGFGHVTTRQNFQLNYVRPADLEPAMRRLAEAGITTSGACGNTVRNVLACPRAGVSPDEVFDVTPYAEAFTRHFLRHPLGHALPRKFKVAFEGCARDHVATAIQDLGFRARLRDGARGFAVTVAGGTSSLCTVGALLVDFLPAADVLALGEAVVRVFHARGDRVNRHRNRLKFLVRALGFEPFRALVLAELAQVRAEGAPALPFDPERPPVEAPPATARPPAPSVADLAARVRGARLRGPGEPPPLRIVTEPAPAALAAFRATNVLPQRQAGHAIVAVSLAQGDATAAQLEALATLAEAYGDGAVRFTSGGHVLLRWVREEDVPALHARLSAAGLGRDGAGTAADVVACPGADVCRLAVTRTRALARLVEDEVRHAVSGAGTAALPVAMSGCPNGCSQHHLAAIGLQGSARKLGGRAVPQYFVLLGGHVDAGGATFGRLAAKVPARRIPEAVARLTSLYLAERHAGEAAGPFFARALDRAKTILADYEQLRLEDTRPEDFVEPGATEDFRPGADAGERAA
ncbi:nitrite/sulfite reductase hemoprotein beta-component ferrodoxin domain protein [Anaeromyxobacter dehalogenans 2CP-1]|uniref:Nitrite/sulfite reductase hemoprotein beta-component ferrodoxin domain protein n=1 Tax=Anaeromyxobacter dehalogenans (strain ATCC BAA-258 / DSM 21875 / 2CP-1) TaxID=455488 RepID=B8JHG8_ANAD2|nr:nitrite/sulfite reductase [Anaeromyxobacter dehalogenans]ACL66680.1 nitrite/sulfite reductase hemoprotein beta-component ferrodoxin domain protein [Anaeromyxobacter dehalogenans 2CP-1]